MTHRTGKTRFFAALQLAALLATPAVGLAGARHRPPDVDFDLDRGMSFGRMPKTAFDPRVFDTMKKALNSRAMDPAIEPYTSAVRPSRYEPSTGRVRDSITDTLRNMRHDEEVSRKYVEATKGAKEQPKTLLPGMPRPQRRLNSPVVDPLLANQKAQKKSDDDD